MVFPRRENLNIQNYHETKKLTLSQKDLLKWSLSLRAVKIPQNPASFLSLFHMIFQFFKGYKRLRTIPIAEKIIYLVIFSL